MGGILDSAPLENYVLVQFFTPFEGGKRNSGVVATHAGAGLKAILFSVKEASVSCSCGRFPDTHSYAVSAQGD